MEETKRKRQAPVGNPSAPKPREALIVERVRAIPEGFVRTYADIDGGAPRMVGRVLATTHEELPWHRVVRSDGTVPMGEHQRQQLRREGVPFKGELVDLAQARLHE
jgi:methylated-DNA-protein-cysteine methyltransferase related protein